MSDLIDDPDSGSNAPEFTVSDVSGAVKRTLESAFGRIRVRGEVGRVFRARSGHLYYDLKDDQNVLACTTWRGQAERLRVVPEEGMEVIVTGRLTAFGAQSKYNLNVDEVAVAGEGALMAMLEKRKQKLAVEGLFAPERKRPLPYLPEVIGVITSPQGAVIRDILHRLRDRFPRRVIVWPVAVQGDRCAPEVAAAIRGFNALPEGGAVPRPDLLIVARGGGSIEDLWGFNEEVVARAAAESRIPLISAVGHETDTTLIDFVSDRRAPTPTAAAEMAVPVRLELLDWTAEQGARSGRAAREGLQRRRQRVQDLARALPRRDSLVASARQRFDRAADRLGPALTAGVQRRRLTLVQLGQALSPGLLRQRIGGLRERVAGRQEQLARALGRLVERRADRLAAVRLSPVPVARAAATGRRDLGRLEQRLADAGARQVARWRDRLEAQERLRQSLGYEATLERGYAVVRGEAGVVTRAAEARTAGRLRIQFADGEIDAGGEGSAPVAPKKPRGVPPEQGSLF